jgi:hypothetical protein
VKLRQAELDLPALRCVLVSPQEVHHYSYLRLAAQPWFSLYNASPMLPPEGIVGGYRYFTVLMWRKDRVEAAQIQPRYPFKNSIMGK